MITILLFFEVDYHGCDFEQLMLQNTLTLTGLDSAVWSAEMNTNDLESVQSEGRFYKDFRAKEIGVGICIVFTMLHWGCFLITLITVSYS